MCSQLGAVGLQVNDAVPFGEVMELGGSEDDQGEDAAAEESSALGTPDLYCEATEL